MGITKSRSHLKIKIKQHLPIHEGHFPSVLQFGLCNTLATFQIYVIGILYDLIHDCLEIYMDDFMTHGNEFYEALENLEKTLIRCKESNLSLNNDKCAMMLTEGIVSGHHISTKGIQVVSTEIKVILNFLTMHSKKRATKFLRICWLLP